MKDERQEKYNTFKDKLVGRLRAYPHIASGAFHLNLRHKDYPGYNRVFLHDPSDPSWPDHGRTTRDDAQARAWVEDYYAPMIFHRVTGEAPKPNRGLMTFGELCDEYLAQLLADLGPDHKTYKNRRSLIERHLKPRFGATRVKDLTREEVATFLSTLIISKPDGDGRIVEKPAKISTKRNFRSGMLAIWRDTMSGPAPFSGIRITRERQRRKRMTKDDFEELLKPKSGAMTADQVFLALVAAMWYDVTILTGRANMRARSVPNTAAAMAVQIGTGMRIEELLSLRWWMVKFDAGYIVVDGSKTGAAERIIPLQDQVRPWLLLLFRMQEERYGRVDDEAYVVHTTLSTPLKQGAVSTAGNRLKEALLFAGLKRQGKRTHWARATHVTWGTLVPELVSLEKLKAYVGHTNPYKDATDAYVANLIAMMPMAHRRYIQHLPSPEQVRAGVATFEPVERTDRNKRRRPPKSEDAAARAAMRQTERLAKLRSRVSGN